MFTNQTAELSLNMPIPAVDAVRADRSTSRFLVGTNSVRSSEDNHLHLIQYYTEANQLGITATLSHPSGPVLQIVTSSTDKSLVLTLAEDTSPGSSAASGGVATLWKIPAESVELGPEDDNLDYDEDETDPFGAANNVVSMEALTTLQSNDSTTGKVVDVAWRGGWDEDLSSHGDVVTLHVDGSLTQWDVAYGSATATRNNNSVRIFDKHHIWNFSPRMAWDPHQAESIAVSMGTIVQITDWRESPKTSSTNMSCPHHRYGVTDLDYNPNKPNTIVTTGKDGLIKFWDLRKTSSKNSSPFAENAAAPSGPNQFKKMHPQLVARGGHRHWATRVSYNPFHDQLIVSTGTDSVVNLWRMSTISSAPLVMLEEDDVGGTNLLPELRSGPEAGKSTSFSNATVPEGPNVRVSRYEHLDSVHAISWGAADAWIYMSASYDGKIVLNHVPSKEKYKILL